MIKTTISKFVNGLLGHSIFDNVVVIESDDWGMIRTASIDALSILSKKYPLQNCNYSKKDSLEREKDVQGLAEVLKSNLSTADQNAIPKFTLNYVTHNPDFAQIEKHGFEKYFRETCLETYVKYENSSGVSKIVLDGIEAGILLPQYHATEHININNWMQSLKNNNEATRHAFRFNIANLHKENHSNCPKEHLDAFGYRAAEAFEKLEETTTTGLNEFEKIFGFRSKSMIAPCYLWDKRLEKAAMANGVMAFQGGTVQKIPTRDGFKKRRHYMGQRGQEGQRYFIRNCQFERVDNPNKDWVDSCLKDIEIAFRFKKPAIISTHRVNYMGRLNEKNRTAGLKQLDLLLKAINKKWPGVQFLSTPELLEKYYS